MTKNQKRRGSSPTVRKGSDVPTKAKTLRREAKAQSVRSPRVSKGKKSAAESLSEFSPTLGEVDLHLFAEGKHERIYDKLGAHTITHQGVKGVAFAVWAPNAEHVSVVGSFNSWDGKRHPLRKLGDSGVWEIFVPKLKAGELYKYEIKTPGLRGFLKADPYAFLMEVPPSTSSIIYQSKYRFRDQSWMAKRANREHFRQPLSIYEVHVGSWRRMIE